MTTYAFAFIVAVGAGIWTPSEEMRYPTLAVCEAARQGVEDIATANGEKVSTTDCHRQQPGVPRVHVYGGAATVTFSGSAVEVTCTGCRP